MIADVLIKLVDSRTDIAGKILADNKSVNLTDTHISEQMIQALVTPYVVFGRTPIVNLVRIDARTTRAIVGEGVAWDGVIVVYVTEVA